MFSFVGVSAAERRRRALLLKEEDSRSRGGSSGVVGRRAPPRCCRGAARRRPTGASRFLQIPDLLLASTYVAPRSHPALRPSHGATNPLLLRDGYRLGSWNRSLNRLK